MTLLKISLTAIALWVVFQKIALDALKESIWRANWGYLLLALLLFNGSKIMSSVRLNQFFRCIGLSLSERDNLRLYYVGMFYNLFLPGGIGGDGYKIYRLHQQYNTGVKALLMATLLDRISGVLALFVLALGLSYGSHVYVAVAQLPHSELFPYLAMMAVIGLVVLFYAYIGYQLPLYKTILHRTNLQAMAVQCLQLLSAMAILRALHVEDNFADYLLLFLISSIAAIVPLTIGGVGMRELVMLLGYAYLPINVQQAVAFSLLFFLITAMSSFLGIFLQE